MRLCDSLAVDSADVKDFFERVSGEWDEMRSSFYNEGVIDALAARADVDTNSTVVDVGTGTGFIAAGLAPHARSVIGVDSSPRMLSVAAGNLAALGVENAMLVEGSVERGRIGGGAERRVVAIADADDRPGPGRGLFGMAAGKLPQDRTAFVGNGERKGVVKANEAIGDKGVDLSGAQHSLRRHGIDPCSQEPAGGATRSPGRGPTRGRPQAPKRATAKFRIVIMAGGTITAR